jgi:molybdopterin-guanine dinucleotide biosynthesis protein A
MCSDTKIASDSLHRTNHPTNQPFFTFEGKDAMQNRFQEMTCFILAGGKDNSRKDFTDIDGLPRLEKGYRRYAAVFEKVKLVLKSEQAREKYLNYPHVCDDDPVHSVLAGLKAALEHAPSDAVFIGSSEIMDFPLELLVNLVKNYQGESYLVYCRDESGSGEHQPLFGIYNKRLAPKLAEALSTGALTLESVLQGDGRMIPLPDDVSGDSLGLN